MVGRRRNDAALVSASGWHFERWRESDRTDYTRSRRDAAFVCAFDDALVFARAGAGRIEAADDCERKFDVKIIRSERIANQQCMGRRCALRGSRGAGGV